MKTLILTFISCSTIAINVWAFEGAEFYQERLDRNYLQSVIAQEEVTLAPEQQELVERRQEMQRVYDLIQDEVNIIFPLFIGALDGQGAGVRFTHQELTKLCAEVENKLAYPRSCMHASKVAAGMTKEDVYRLQLRRKKHRQIYLARLNSLDSSLQNTGVAAR